MWHVSVSWRGRPADAPLPLQRWNRQQRDLARKRARALLGDVGMKPERLDRGGQVAHLRKALTDAEIARLPPEFLACPAVDVAGGDGRRW